MIRVLLINAFLFLLPFALTYIWVRFIAAKKPDAQTRKYYAFAALIGLGLVVAGLLTYRATTVMRRAALIFHRHIKTGRLSPAGLNRTDDPLARHT